MRASLRWLCLVVLLSGCSSRVGPTRVTGQLTLDGSPLAGILVTFRGKALEGEFGGKTGPDGRFDVAVNGKSGQYGKPGRYVVMVTRNRNAGITAPPGKVAADDEEQLKELMKGTVPGLAAGHDPLPRVYSDAATSPLEVEIKDGATELEPLDLKTDPSKR
jgi:hypothetical protein